MSTTSTFTELKSYNSEVVGKVRLLIGAHTKGEAYNVQMHVTGSMLDDREILDTLKSFIGYEKGLDTVKFCHSRDIPGQITLTLKDVRSKVQAKSVAEKCINRLIRLKERQHNCTPAIAVNSTMTRSEMYY